MTNYIIHVYADLVRKGAITIDKVPEKHRAEVEALLTPAE